MQGMSDFEATIHLRSEQSAGELSIIELRLAPGWDGPPLHHHDFDEAFYVLAGELTFQLGERRRVAGPGEVVFAPRGSHHTLANHGSSGARYLLVCTPGGFERYFDRLAAEHAGVEPPPEAWLPYPETTVVGPQLPAG